MFEIEGKDISELSDSDLRSLIGLLCEAELREMDLPTAGVTWGGHQNAKDGGIDVRVELNTSIHKDGFIPRSNTGYQVKKPDMPRNAIYKEMLANDEPKQVIKDLIESNGAYIIVSSQGSTADSALQDRKEAMQEVVNRYSISSTVMVDFYDRERIAGWVRSFPAIVMWVREKIGRPIQGWRTYGNWSRSPGGVEEDYLLNEHIRLYNSGNPHSDGLSAIEGLNELRSILKRPKSNVRLVGLSGVGKTRLIQALYDERIGNDPLNPSCVFYTDMSDAPTPDPISVAERLVNLKVPATLVIDNCPPDLHNRLVAVGIESNSLLSIISVEYDVRDDQPEETEVYRLEQASSELIGGILEKRFRHLSQVNVRTIAEFSGGNARIAIALANTVKRGENLTGLRDTVLFNRLFEQRNEPNSCLLKVAEVCSLIYSFDSQIDDKKNNELAILGSLIEMSDRQVYENVSELIRRDLVQKRSIWRAVLPHAIANKLAQRALESIPIHVICNTFEYGVSERLLKSFSRRLSFLNECEGAIEISRRWLEEGGLLGDVSNLNDLGISILNNIAPVNPELILSSIERVLQLEDASTFFSRDNPNYSEFTRLLRSIAYDKTLFERSASLLCRFALSERPDENYNSIRRMIKSLFYIYLSGTHASPEQRLNVIDKLITSHINDQMDLGLLLLDASLKTHQFTSEYCFEFGSRSRDYGFYPYSKKELQHWYKVFIQYTQKLIITDSPVANKAKAILGDKFSGLWIQAKMFDELEICSREISDIGFWGEGWTAIKSIRKYESSDMDLNILSRLNDLDLMLKPTTLMEKIRLYVLSEDSFSLEATIEESNEDEFNQVGSIVRSLGCEVGSDYDIFKDLLEDVLSANNWLLFNFGQGLVEGTINPELIWEEFVSQLTVIERPDPNYQVIRGFLKAISRSNKALCKKILDKAITSNIIANIFPFLQTIVEIDELGVKRLINSLELGVAPISQYRNLAFGGAHETINDKDLCDLLRLISYKPEGLEVSIDILNMRFHGLSKKCSASDTIFLLGQELLSEYQFSRKDSRNDKNDYKLANIIKACYVTDAAKENVKLLAGKLVEGFNNYDIYPWDYRRVIEAIATCHPIVFLETFLEDNNDKGDIERIFLDNPPTESNPFVYINDNLIIEWCEVKPKTRYLLVARAITPFSKDELDNKLMWTPLALNVMVNAEDPSEILNTFKHAFWPRSWSGSLAEKMKTRLGLLYELKNHEDTSVSRWAFDQQSVIERAIRFERESELQEERLRNERFE